MKGAKAAADWAGNYSKKVQAQQAPRGKEEHEMRSHVGKCRIPNGAQLSVSIKAMYAAGALAGDFSTAREETAACLQEIARGKSRQENNSMSFPASYPGNPRKPRSVQRVVQSSAAEVQDRADYAVRMALDAADTVPGAGGLTTYEPARRAFKRLKQMSSLGASL